MVTFDRLAGGGEFLTLNFHAKAEYKFNTFLSIEDVLPCLAQNRLLQAAQVAKTIIPVPSKVLVVSQFENKVLDW